MFIVDFKTILWYYIKVYLNSSAPVAELVDAPDLGSGIFDVGVQVSSGAPGRALSWFVLLALLFLLHKETARVYGIIFLWHSSRRNACLDAFGSSVTFFRSANLHSYQFFHIGEKHIITKLNAYVVPIVFYWYNKMWFNQYGVSDTI